MMSRLVEAINGYEAILKDVEAGTTVSNDVLMTALGNLGAAYQESGNFDSAIYYYKQVLYFVLNLYFCRSPVHSTIRPETLKERGYHMGAGAEAGVHIAETCSVMRCMLDKRTHRKISRSPLFLRKHR